MPAAPWNPARVDFVTLHLFRAVAHCGNLTRAAAQCHLAVSAASRRLAELEAAAGVRLLERSYKGVALTPAGHVALQHATHLLQAFEQFGREITEYSAGVEGHVHLHSNVTALTAGLPATVARFCESNPSIRVEIEERLSADVTRALVDGVADVGLFVAYDASSLPTTIQTAAWCEDELIVLCPLDHPLAGEDEVRLAEVFEHDIVSLADGALIAKMMSAGADEAGMNLRQRVQVRSYDVLCHVVAANLGIGLCSSLWWRQNARDGDHLRVVQLAHPLARRTIFAGLGPRGIASQAAQLFWDELLGPGRPHARDAGQLLHRDAARRVDPPIAPAAPVPQAPSRPPRADP